jgi:Mg2+ and Co2+ transporter CorA
VVDRILEIMDEYQDKINELEHDVLLKPSMNAVRSLHILSGDLILHKRTLEPIKTMILGLRRYDLDRCTALLNNMEAEADRMEAIGARRRGRYQGQRHHNDSEELLHLVSRDKKPKKAVGYLSYKSKVYLVRVISSDNAEEH